MAWSNHSRTGIGKAWKKRVKEVRKMKVSQGQALQPHSGIIHKKEKGETNLRNADGGKNQCGEVWELKSPNARSQNTRASVIGEDLT